MCEIAMHLCLLNYPPSVRPILETSPSSSLTVEEGEPALLSCALTSGSADHLYWRRANTKVSQVQETVLSPFSILYLTANTKVSQVQLERKIQKFSLE